MLFQARLQLLMLPIKKLTFLYFFLLLFVVKIILDIIIKVNLMLFFFFFKCRHGATCIGNIITLLRSTISARLSSQKYSKLGFTTNSQFDLCLDFDLAIRTAFQYLHAGPFYSRRSE